MGAIEWVRCGDTYLAVGVKESSGLYRLVVLRCRQETTTTSLLEGKYVVDYGCYQGDNLYLHTLDGLSVDPFRHDRDYGRFPEFHWKDLHPRGSCCRTSCYFPDHLYAVGTNHLYDIGYVGDERDSKLIYGWNYFGYVQPKSGKPVLATCSGRRLFGARRTSPPCGSVP